MFYLYNERSCFYAHRDSKGQHDGLTTVKLIDAATFETFGKASEYSQNFGPDWIVKGETAVQWGK